MKLKTMKAFYGDAETLLIAHMHDQYGFPIAHQPQLLESTQLWARGDFMAEELKEYFNAVEAGDIVEIFDALLDIVVVAKGTAALMGLPWAEGMQEVMRSNMSKVPGNNHKRPNQKYDLVKPEGWEPPDLDNVILKAVDQPSEEHR